MSKIIGIDLGTTNSCVTVMQDGVPVVIVNVEGERTTPSVVAFKGDLRLVGEVAKRQATTNPETVFSIKSKMGYHNKIRLGGQLLTPEEISAMILQTLKTQAESYLGEPVRKAVITVPAYFNDAQRQATKDAGRIAGLEVSAIINEPTAAALAYGMDKLNSNQTILVYDLGGGTFDVSILEITDGMFEVRSTAGSNNLGGDNFDEALTEYIIKQFDKEHGINLALDVIPYNRVREAAEFAKRDLSAMKSTTISLPFITVKEGAGLHLEQTITRELFESLTKDLLEATRQPVQQAMFDAGLTAEDLDRVILVGGSTRMPAVSELVKELTGQVPYKGVNPDEVVALGAAIKGGIINGEVEDLVLVDVAPLSLGIQTAGGLFSKIIERNTPIPVSKSQMFTTASDRQHTVTVHVLQGERSMAIDNNPIGHFQLTDILPAPAGVPQIEVTFSIDHNGIVSVSAKDKRTGRAQTVVMQTESGLTDSEIARMVKNAERYATQDAKRVRDAEVVNEVSKTLTDAKKLVIELGSKVSSEEKINIDLVASELKSVLEDGEVSALVEPLNRLKSIRDTLAVRSYREAN